MKSTLDKYIKELKELLEYVESTMAINDKISKSNDKNNRNDLLELISSLNTKISKRKYDYNLVIITLYGFLESYLEQIIKAYLQKLNYYIKRFDDLPEVIKKNHIILSADLIKNTFVLNKYNNISAKDVINNLSSCVNDDKEYNINTDAFTHHTSNFRVDVIRDFFKNVGITNITQDIYKEESLKEYYINVENFTEIDFSIHQENYYYTILDDLAERRNQIAHGSDNDQLLSLDILANYIIYIIAFIKSVYFIIEKSLNKLRFEKCKRIELGKPIKVYNNSIVCINSNHQNINVGDTICSHNISSNDVKVGKINSLQLNNESVNFITNAVELPIGIGVDFHAKENCLYYIFE